MPKSANEVFRDFVRYTGDGAPNEPVGHPLPVGDPRSGVHNPDKRDIREAFLGVDQSAAAAQAAQAAAEAAAGSATGTPQYASVALAQAATVASYATAIIVDGSVYVRDQIDGGLVTGDGKRWALLDFRGRFDRLVASMLDGKVTKIVAYGDSTTDGTGTTGWVQNPLNGTPHMPANAWPVIATGTIRDMFLNASITIHNAGAYGQQIKDGWAYDNFDLAVIQPYGTPDAVIVGFGINDTRLGLDVAEFERQLLRLCRRIGRHGAFPIFVLPDEPASQDHNGWLLGRVRGIYLAVAERLGVKVIDWGGAINQIAQCADGSKWRWAEMQPDDTHGGDAWHSVKGGFIAASIYPNTIWVTQPIVNIPSWSKYARPKLPYTVSQTIDTGMGGSHVVAANSYAVRDVLLALWVWSVGASRQMLWSSVDANGFYLPRAAADGLKIGIYNYTTRAESEIIAPGVGQIRGGASDLSSDELAVVGRIPNGLSRWRVRAPADNAANNVYLGYFSIREMRNAFRMAAPLFQTGLTERKISDLDPEGDAHQVIGLRFGEPLEVAITVDLSQGLGVALWSSRVSATGITGRKHGLFLFRSGTDTLVLYRAVYNADGSVVSYSALAASSALSWPAQKPLRVSGLVSASGFSLRIYDGWTSPTPVITHTTNVLPWSGTPGAVWQEPAGAGVAAITIHGGI